MPILAFLRVNRYLSLNSNLSVSSKGSAEFQWHCKHPPLSLKKPHDRISVSTNHFVTSKQHSVDADTCR